MRWVLTAPPRGHTRETREGGARVRREESGDGSEWSRGGGRTRGHTRRTRRREEQCRRGRGIEYGCGEMAPQRREGGACWRAVERRCEAILADPPKEAQGRGTPGDTRDERGVGENNAAGDEGLNMDAARWRSSGGRARPAGAPAILGRRLYWKHPQKRPKVLALQGAHAASEGSRKTMPPGTRD